MIEFIRKQDAINALGEEPEVWYDDDYEIGARDEWVSNKLSIEALDRVDVKPFIRAKWIVEENTSGFLTRECSNGGRLKMTIVKVGVIIFVSGFSVSMIGLLVMFVGKILEEML